MDHIPVFEIPAEQMLQRAFDALRRTQFALAETNCRAFLKSQPQRADGWLLLARVVMEMSRIEEVDAILDEAKRRGASESDLLLSRSSLRWRQGRDDEAIDDCRRVLALQPNQMEASLRLATCLRRSGRPDEALAVTARFRGHPVAESIAAWAHLDRKDPLSAIQAAKAGIAATAADAAAGATRSNLLHVMGFAHEARGQYAEAMIAYTASNEAIPLRVDEAAIRRDIDGLRRYFTSERMRSLPSATVRSDRPVFIASMPRSGTTLVDRIIAAHPRCAGAGETRALRTQVQEWSGPGAEKTWPTILDTFTGADFDRIATRYLRETDQFGANALRMADKHLMNWTMVGLASLALPDARIIHLRRDPMDTGISCFERLRPGQIAWSRSLRLIGVTLKACDTLMEHWKSVVGKPVLTVEYESLVRNAEVETRRIIEFLGIPWDDACLQHHRRTGTRAGTENGTGTGESGGRSQSASEATSPSAAAFPPPTLSSEQAAKPIYDSSIGRGARFGAALDPLREAYAEPF
jgi:Sulfotransferase family